jgi:hypothetical protein
LEKLAHSCFSFLRESQILGELHYSCEHC